jgi:hypothetical protein
MSIYVSIYGTVSIFIGAQISHRRSRFRHRAALSIYVSTYATKRVCQRIMPNTTEVEDISITRAASIKKDSGRASMV